MTSSQITAWVDAYVRAWGGADAAGVAALLTEDARYLTELTEWWMEHPEQ